MCQGFAQDKVNMLSRSPSFYLRHGERRGRTNSEKTACIVHQSVTDSGCDIFWITGINTAGVLHLTKHLCGSQWQSSQCGVDFWRPVIDSHLNVSHCVWQRTDLWPNLHVYLSQNILWCFSVLLIMIMEPFAYIYIYTEWCPVNDSHRFCHR